MKKRILILGHFGLKNEQLDGQTIKTRNVYELFALKTNKQISIDLFDTQNFHYSKFYMFISFFKLFFKLFRCNKLLYLPAHNNLKYLFPLLFIVCRVRNIEMIYFVVGGWLYDFLKSKKIHITFLSHIKAILTESQFLNEILISEYHFKNVITVPNFRIHSFIPKIYTNPTQFKIVFMARINKMKGLDYIFGLGDFLMKMTNISRTITVDIFGPIEAGDQDYFSTNILKYKNLNYKGTIKPEKIYETLCNYDILVFPTHYYTEGFPGTVLDAYIAGLPVVATHWKYATDFITDGETGFLVPFENSATEFINSVLKLYNNNELLLRMKKNAYLRSEKYSTEKIWEILAKNKLID